MRKIAKKIIQITKKPLKKLPVILLKYFFGFLIVVTALFGITFDSIAKKIFYDKFPLTSIYLREEELQCLHIDFSREYIEDKLGMPKYISEIQISHDTYLKAIYTDKYYTLLCFYDQTGSLVGYMMISNKDGFEFNSYRCDIKLLEYSVSEAREKLENQGIESDIITKKHFESDRIDNNKYYYECKMQHSWGGQETYYIGFGFTDIGYHNVKIEPGINPENFKINFITIFKEFSCEGPDDIKKYSAIDFINKEVVKDYCAGISKGELTNLSEYEDFNKKIEEYLKE